MNDYRRYQRRLRETIIGIVVGALAIGIFVGAVFMMGPDSSQGGDSSLPAEQPAAPVADDQEFDDEDSPG